MDTDIVNSLVSNHYADTVQVTVVTWGRATAHTEILSRGFAHS